MAMCSGCAAPSCKTTSLSCTNAAPTAATSSLDAVTAPIVIRPPRACVRASAWSSRRDMPSGFGRSARSGTPLCVTKTQRRGGRTCVRGQTASHGTVGPHLRTSRPGRESVPWAFHALAPLSAVHGRPAHTLHAPADVHPLAVCSPQPASHTSEHKRSSHQNLPRTLAQSVTLAGGARSSPPHTHHHVRRWRLRLRAAVMPAVHGGFGRHGQKLPSVPVRLPDLRLVLASTYVPRHPCNAGALSHGDG